MRVYKPAPSNGARWILGMGVLMLLSSLPVFAAAPAPIGPLLITVVAAILWPLAITSFLIAWWFRTTTRLRG